MKFTVADKIIHRNQETEYSCGAASIAMMLGIQESLAISLVKCNKSGTNSDNVLSFLNNSVAKSHLVYIKKNYHEIIDDLISISLKYPIYCVGKYYWKNPGPGRPMMRCHACLIADGKIYDPSENKAVDAKSYEYVFNKRLTFERLIIVDVERPNYLNNFRKYESGIIDSVKLF